MTDLELWKTFTKDIIPLKNTKVKTSIKNIYFKKSYNQINYTLDLHGYTVQEAYDRLLFFINSHKSYHTKYIIVITGKGSINKEGLIHKEIENWLSNNSFKSYIKSFNWINGNGALKIFLKI